MTPGAPGATLNQLHITTHLVSYGVHIMLSVGFSSVKL